MIQSHDFEPPGALRAQSHHPIPYHCRAASDPVKAVPMWPPAHARSLLSQLSARDDDDCTSGTQFYRCGSNGYRGCCSVDPCDREDCPDSPTLPAIYVSSRIGPPTEPPTFVIPNMSTTSEEMTSTTTEAETTTSATSTTESEEGSDEEETSSEEPSTTTTTAVEESTTFSTSLRGATTETGTQTTSLEAASTSILASATKEPDTDRGAAGDDTGLSQAQIGGIVGGVVFLLLLVSILAVFFFRRRAKKQKTQHQESSDSPDVEGKDKTMSLMGSPGSQDPFAPFGAVHELDTAEELLPELPGQHEYTDAPAVRPSVVPSATSGRVDLGYRVRDPRATLNGTVNDEGRPAYVNHWSQYQ